MTKIRRVPISERALVARINRALAKDGRALRRSREGTRSEFDFGRYYLLDTEIPNIVEDHVDLEDMGRELKVLQEYEALADDPADNTGKLTVDPAWVGSNLTADRPTKADKLTADPKFKAGSGKLHVPKRRKV